MKIRNPFYLLSILFISIPLWADPIIVLDPQEYETDLETGQVEEFPINIINDGEDPLLFTIEHEIINEPRFVNEDDNRAPLRDDIGERIREYEFNETQWFGVTWDGRLIWGLDMGRQRLVGYDPEREEIAENINIEGQFIGLTWDGETFWTCRMADDNGRDPVIVRINMEGDIVSTLGVRGNMPIAIAFNGENLLYHSVRFREERVIISEINFEGEQVAETDITEVVEGFGLSITWVEEHEDGQLWVKAWGAGNIYQMNIDGEAPDVLQEGDLERAEISGLSHDGEYLLYISDESSNIRVIDDGVSEITWLDYEPRDGELEEGEDLDIIVTLDAEDLVEGDYEAELIITSNDPENPEMIVNILMHITGIPELEVIWSEDIGFPEVVDWNRAFPDMFNGFPYEIPVLIRNSGTAELIVEEINSESEEFGVEQGEFTLDPDEEREIEIMFQSDESGNYESEITINWNSPDDEDYVIAVVAVSSEPPIITADPDAIEHDFDIDNQTEEFVITISNDGESDLRFIIEHEIIAEPGDERDIEQRHIRQVKGSVGPERDDLGDLIAEYNPGRGAWLGLAWDGDLMWGLDIEGRRLAGFDPEEEEVVEEVNLNDQYIGLTFDGEAFWTAAFVMDDEGRENMIFRIDFEGNVLESFQAQGIMTLSLTFDGENLWYHNLDFDREMLIIRQVTLEGEQLREVDCSNAVGNIQNISISWVDEHDDGHMWAADWDGNRLYQLNIENEQAELIQQTEIARGEPHQIDHDGENIWYSTMEDVWRVIDDGITELSWLSYEPTEGEIENGGDLDIVVTLDATGLYGGDYEADLIFLSNDPENPELAVNILMHVTGFPVLLVSWDEDIGYPEQINWNRAYEDIFTGGLYDVPIRLENIGTDLLVIEDISFNNELFSTENNEFEISPGEHEDIILTFNADEDGEHAAQMTINWEGLEEIISLVVVCTGPPEIDLSVDAIEVDIAIGERDESIVNIANNGAGTLRYSIEHELISEPERYNHHDPAGPVRDDLGDVIDEFQMGRAAWSGIAWDGQLMWGIDFERQRMISLNPETDRIENRNELNRPYMGMAYDGESFWMGQVLINDEGEDFSTRLAQVDRDGNVIVTLDVVGTEILGVAFNGENLLYYSLSIDLGSKTVREITRDGEHVGEVSLDDILPERDNALSISWVANHSEGNLWVLSWVSATMYQVDVFGDEPVINQQAQLTQSEIYDVEHDGTNMWYTTDRENNGVWYVIDDGISEATWLSYEPDSGTLESNEETDIAVRIDATEMDEGQYEADMHFKSNDIENGDEVISVSVAVSPSSVDEEISLPNEFSMSNAYPNPFNSSTTLQYNVPNKAAVSLSIYDIAGHLVTTLVEAEHNAGTYIATWDGQNNASGVYFVKMVSGDFNSIKRVALVR